MTLKTYSQNCGLAGALDVLGDRWTLLIIRSLLAGPARFSEIMAQLPGIGTNLLAARLKSLGNWGVIEKREGRQSSYELTEQGEALRPILHQLARWGRPFISANGVQSQPNWVMFNIEASFRPERAENIDAVVGFDLGGNVFHIIIRRQTCRAVAGTAIAPDVSIRSDSDSLQGEGARMQIMGDSGVFDRVRPCFDL